jgi:hypothetical protein
MDRTKRGFIPAPADKLRATTGQRTQPSRLERPRRFDEK